jgi:hypothetical protein
VNESHVNRNNGAERGILDRILEMRQKTRRTKFVGALTIELLRKEFARIGLNVSNRDVFIENVPNEIDLIIAKLGKHPEENLVYNANNVLAVLEIKFRGSYGQSSIGDIKEVFDSVKKANNRVECLYVSVSENRNYKYRATKDNLGYDCYELLTRNTNLESALVKGSIQPTGDWKKLLEKLSSLS